MLIVHSNHGGHLRHLINGLPRCDDLQQPVVYRTGLRVSKTAYAMYVQRCQPQYQPQPHRPGMLTTAGSFTGLYASGVTQSTFSYATFTPPAPNAFSTSPPPRSRSQHFPFLRLGDGQLGYNPPLRRQRHRLNYNDWLAHTSTSLGAQAVQFSGGWFGKDITPYFPCWAAQHIDFHLSPRGDQPTVGAAHHGQPDLDDNRRWPP